MKNYIVRNCPAMEAYCTCGKYYDNDKQISTRCKDITDCVLKRIVEFVKWRDEESVCNSCGLGIPHRKEEFQRILNMLEIEEVRK